MTAARARARVRQAEQALATPPPAPLPGQTGIPLHWRQDALFDPPTPVQTPDPPKPRETPTHYLPWTVQPFRDGHKPRLITLTGSYL
ncbi:hypothetical protein [Streptomyces zhihengii]